jgi:hypothetical protein
VRRELVWNVLLVLVIVLVLIGVGVMAGRFRSRPDRVERCPLRVEIA